MAALVSRGHFSVLQWMETKGLDSMIRDDPWVGDTISRAASADRNSMEIGSFTVQ